MDAAKSRFDPADQDIEAVVLAKGTERYVFYFVRSQRKELTGVLARFANDPDLSFNWYDAAVISKKLRTELH